MSPEGIWVEFVDRLHERGLCGFFWRNRSGGVYVCQRVAGHQGAHRDGLGTTV